MLKIKDNVDLKVLKKFGYDKYTDFKDYCYIKTLPTDREINITSKREIYSFSEIDVRPAQEFEVKDLIQAGLVEKVEEE